MSIDKYTADHLLSELESRIIRLQVDTTNIGAVPSIAQLDAAFGSPAHVGAGFLAIVDDNGAGTAVFLVISDGTNWWYESLTKLVA